MTRSFTPAEVEGSLHAQLHAPVLDISAGYRGYRLWYVGGVKRELIHDANDEPYDALTREEVIALHTCAIWAATWIKAVCRQASMRGAD